MLSHKWLTNILLGVIAFLVSLFGSIGTAAWMKQSTKIDETADAVKDIKAGVEYNKANVIDLKVRADQGDKHDAEQDSRLQKLDNMYSTLTDAKHLARTEIPSQKSDTGFLQESAKDWAGNNIRWPVYPAAKGLPQMGGTSWFIRYTNWWHHDRRGLSHL